MTNVMQITFSTSGLAGRTDYSGIAAFGIFSLIRFFRTLDSFSFFRLSISPMSFTLMSSILCSVTFTSSGRFDRLTIGTYI